MECDRVVGPCQFFFFDNLYKTVLQFHYHFHGTPKVHQDFIQFESPMQKVPNFSCNSQSLLLAFLKGDKQIVPHRNTTHHTFVFSSFSRLQISLILPQILPHPSHGCRSFSIQIAPKTTVNTATFPCQIELKKLFRFNITIKIFTIILPLLLSTLLRSIRFPEYQTALETKSFLTEEPPNTSKLFRSLIAKPNSAFLNISRNFTSFGCSFPSNEHKSWWTSKRFRNCRKHFFHR
jgi:hypothetical protein